MLFEEKEGFCSFCKKKKWLVFYEGWKTQKKIQERNIFLCLPCTKKYGQLPNNFENDLKINKLNEEMDKCLGN